MIDNPQILENYVIKGYLRILKFFFFFGFQDAEKLINAYCSLDNVFMYIQELLKITKK